MNREQIASQISTFLQMKFPRSQNAECLDEHGSLLDSGIMDSLGVLDLVHFLEKEFEINISDDELIAENFDAVEQIVVFVAAKRNEQVIS